MPQRYNFFLTYARKRTIFFLFIEGLRVTGYGEKEKEKNQKKKEKFLLLYINYRRFGTQTNQNGWVRTFLPDEQRTIYVKQCIS